MTAAPEPVTPVIPKPAATLMLVRGSAAGLEVLMQVRHTAMSFASGAMVFPGGRVDEEDRALIRHAKAEVGADEKGLMHRIAAIRETFEECGVLLARRGGAYLSEAAVEPLRRRYRAGESFAALVAAEGLEVAADGLVPFAHWITPPSSPKRFDTLFYMAEAPHGQSVSHDGDEATEVLWMTPQQAMIDGDAGVRSIMFATYLNLMRLAAYDTPAAALAAARVRRIVAIVPEVVDSPTGKQLRIPAEADYDVTEMPLSRMKRG